MRNAFHATESYILALAYYLAVLVKEHLTVFEEYEKDKRNKLFSKTFVDRFLSSIAQLTKLQGQQQGSSAGKKTAVNRELQARVTIKKSLDAIREDIKIYNEEDEGLQKAFGLGRALRNSSPTLLAAGGARRSSRRGTSRSTRRPRWIRAFPRRWWMSCRSS